MLFKKVKDLLQFSSDLHLEKGFKRNIIAKKPYLLLCGDIGYPNEETYEKFLLDISSSFDKIFILSGNHEYDNCKDVEDIEDKIVNICMKRKNLVYLQKSTYTLCKKDRIILAGCTLWSELPKIKYQYHLDHKEWINNILDDNPNDNYIVATHHCPLFECLNKKYNYKTLKYFASEQIDLIKKNNLLMWIHGHSHINKTFNIHGKWILSNQYGSYEDPLYKYEF
jgi:Icc-related predicted phosphoesterase